MKQYIKSEPIKWDFKFLFRCSSKTGYLYQMDIYLGKKQNTKFKLNLIEKLFDKNTNAIRTVRKNRKKMQKMLEDKNKRRDDCQFLCSKNVMTCKWMDNRSVLLVSAALEGMDVVSSVQRIEKGSAIKSVIPCPTVVSYTKMEWVGLILWINKLQHIG